MFRRAAVVIGVFLIMIMGGGLFLILNQTAGRPVMSLTLADTVPEGKTTLLSPRGEVLRVAVAAVLSPRETLDSYQELVNYLGEKLGRPTQLVQRRTYAEVNDLVESGNIDIAFVCSGAYVAGRDDFGMELLVVPLVGGQAVYYSYIIVPKDSEVRTLEQLRGKTFAFTDPLSNSGRLSPAYILAQMGETPESFFRSSIFTYSHDNSIRAVAEKMVDGAAVDSLVYDYAAAKGSPYPAATRIIHISPPYPIPPVVVHPNIDPELSQQLKAILLTMHLEERGQAILNRLLIDRFVLGDDSAYDITRAMRQSIKTPLSSR